MGFESVNLSEVCVGGGIGDCTRQAGTFERLWRHQLARVKERAEEVATKQAELRRITKEEEK